MVEQRSYRGVRCKVPEVVEVRMIEKARLAAIEAGKDPIPVIKVDSPEKQIENWVDRKVYELVCVKKYIPIKPDRIILSEVDVERDLFEITVYVSPTNDIEPEMLSYYIEIAYWTSTEISIQLSF